MNGNSAKSLYKITILIIVIALFLFGCGISTTAYLYPPLIFSVEPSVISIRNDGTNYEPSEGSKQTYLGVNIYYRIFQVRQDAEAVHIQLTNASSTYDGNPDAFMNYAEGQGFVYMREATNSSQPSITIAPTDENRHIISTSSWELDNDSSYILERNINRQENSFLEKNFDADDPDYKGADSTGGGSFYMVLFAVSYGEDTIGAAVYSDPVVATSILEF